MDGHSDLAARAQLRRLLAMARDNEEKLRRFNEQELRLMATTSLSEVVTRVVRDFPAAFGLEQVTLALADPKRELADLLEANMAAGVARHVLLLGDDQLALLGGRKMPALEGFAQRHTSYFPAAQPLASVALLPLRRGDECIGSLNLGSTDPRRYTPGSRTDFLERLAAVVAICIENGMNNERVRRLGFTDPLTGVNNRRYLDERLGEAVAGAAREAQPLACMFLDVDHFKRFNDDYGHAAGDDVLREAAQRMRAELRRSDVLCRYGGEEFVALLPRTSLESAREIAERIRLAVARAVRLGDGRPVSLSLSIGVAAVTPPLPVPDHMAAALLRAADEAVYEAKAAGRNRVVLARSAA